MRRRAPRHEAGWKGICLMDDDVPVTDWRECDVLDISLLGLALAVADHRVDELIGRHISVEFPAVSDSVSVCLDGIIRNALRINTELVRLGIEFIGMSTVEQAIATVLGALIEIDGPEALLKR
jgi:hypothetical protein